MVFPVGNSEHDFGSMVALKSSISSKGINGISDKS
jgi:hypothetical protein